MELQIIGQTKDWRTNTDIIYAQISIDSYLELVGENFDEFVIQRKQEKHKAYNRMMEDILAGAVLPPITLAVKPVFVEEIKRLINANDLFQVENKLSSPNRVYILDGLQRTYILSHLKKQGKHFRNEQRLLLEFWIEKEVKHLIYRLIILNAGQKAMSLRHQLEMLNITLYENIQMEIQGIELRKEKDETRRTKPNSFSFESIISSYYCFLTKNYEPNKENLITRQIQEESVIYATEVELNDKFVLFKHYLNFYTQLDYKVYAHYGADVNLKLHIHWFAKENVMNSFFAAAADYGNNSPEKQQRILLALTNLLTSFENENDALGIEIYEEVTQAIDASKKNIGLAKKRILFEGFREFFMNKGEKPFFECWKTVAN
jgi:hypothetical protein